MCRTTTTTTTSTSNSNSNSNQFDWDQWQSGGLTSLDQTCFAAYWSELPTIAATGVKINPYSFRDRMALGKHLILETCQQLDMAEHWFWGYLAQMDWQRRSGRFQDPADWKDGESLDVIASCNQVDDISDQSWWGHMNLSFSVAVYVGAAHANLVPPIVLQPNTMNENEAYHECVQHWQRFWQLHHREFTTTKDVDKLYQNLWSVHTEVIVSGVQHGKLLQDKLPEMDRHVGLGWCHMVELLASMNWTLLSLNSLLQFGVGFLPTIRVTGRKSLDWLQWNRPKEYTTVHSLFQLREASPHQIQYMCAFWKRVAFWTSIHHNLPPLLNDATHGSLPVKIYTVTKLLFYAALPQTTMETGVWLSVLFGAGYYYHWAICN